MASLYRAIGLPSEEPVQFVGVSVLRWHDHPGQPALGFVEVDDDILTEFAKLCREYPGESADTLLDMALTLTDANVIYEEEA